jgi:hypothetical protein
MDFDPLVVKCGGASFDKILTASISYLSYIYI